MFHKRIATLKCRVCGSEICESLTYCSTCRTPAGFPNVRAANKDEEVEALENRYENALDSANLKGSIAIIRDFEKKLKSSHAVINTGIDTVHQILTDNRYLYTNYTNLVKGSIRKPANPENSGQRIIVGAKLFADYSDEIVYAALSLDGDGLLSYGELSIVIREIVIKDRASLLEDNSYHFIVKHSIQIDDNIPSGYRATWPSKHKLAISKLEPKISSTTKPDEYPKILLFNSGKRERDEFLEVHIYGGFDSNAIDYVKGSSKKHPPDMIARIKSMLIKSGKRWIER